MKTIPKSVKTHKSRSNDRFADSHYWHFAAFPVSSMPSSPHTRMQRMLYTFNTIQRNGEKTNQKRFDVRYMCNGGNRNGHRYFDIWTFYPRHRSSRKVSRCDAQVKSTKKIVTKMDVEHTHISVWNEVSELFSLCVCVSVFMGKWLESPTRRHGRVNTEHTALNCLCDQPKIGKSCRLHDFNNCIELSLIILIHSSREIGKKERKHKHIELSLDVTGRQASPHTHTFALAHCKRIDRSHYPKNGVSDRTKFRLTANWSTLLSWYRRGSRKMNE